MITPTKEQQAAFDMVFSAAMPIGIISGGPGVGKTAILDLILAEADRRRWRYALAAPTAKAAKRMTECTGRPATTIHRLIGVGGRRAKSPADPLRVDLLVIDEISMLDLMLFHAVLYGLAPGARLLLVGDKDQLPPVGPGCVLRDLIASGRVPVAMLTQVMRQDERSLIHRNAQRVNRGEMPIIPTRPEDSDDFWFEEIDDAAQIPARVAWLIRDAWPCAFPVNPKTGAPWDLLRDIQVLTPMRTGAPGVDAMNLALREALNPRRPGASEDHTTGRSAAKRVWRVGDKVLHTRNRYDLACFNGDSGIIVGIGKATREQAEIHGAAVGETLVWVDYGEDEFGAPKVVPYTEGDLGCLAVAWASTVHKSQGSEYPVAIVICHSCHTHMLSRQILYTAISRGKQAVFVVGDLKGLRRAVRNGTPAQRWTRLAEMLQRGGATEMQSEQREDVG